MGAGAQSSGWAALVLGLLGVATSGPFFVMLGMDPYASVFWRTLLAGLLALLVSAQLSPEPA